MITLKGKSALITGSGRGIGKEIAAKFAEAGADVCISDIDLATAQEAATEISAKYGVKAIAIAANVAVEAEVSELVKKMVEEFGKIDVLINNAGITKDGPLISMKEDAWDAVLDVNLKSAFLCSKAAIRFMRKQKSGSVINISSISGQTGLPGQANYSASKAGMIGLTQSNAKEYASSGITVNAIAPGFIRTAMTDKLSVEVVKGYEDAIPMKTLGVPEDIANAALFLASPLASYVTGQVIAVNGGLYI